MEADAHEVKVAVLHHPFEAQLLEEVLAEQGIPYRIRSYYDEVYGNLFQVHKGWGAVYAPAPFKDRILGHLRDVRQAEIDPDEWQRISSNEDG